MSFPVSSYSPQQVRRGKRGPDIKMMAGKLNEVIGELAEWSKAAVLKTVEGQPSGGSNPSLSAIAVCNFWTKMAL